MIGTLSMLLIAVDRQILPTVLPAIMEEFHMNSVQAGLLNSLNFVGTFAGAALVGFIADRIGTGHRRVWTWSASCIVTMLSGLATFFTKGVFGLQFWRVIMGVGTGAMEPISAALVSDFWQKENRGFALGVNQTGMPFGQFVGPILLSAVLAYGTWRDAFLWIPLIGVVMMLIQLSIGTAANERRVYHWIDEKHLTRPVANRNQTTHKQVLSNAIQSLKNRNVVLTILIDFLFLWTEQGIVTFLTYRLTSELGLSLSLAALISGASGITGWMGQIVWGTISDHYGRKFSLTILTAGTALSALGCIFINSATTGWIILIIWGIFRNSPYSVINSLIIDSTPETAASSLGLLVGIGFGLSGALVAPVVGYIIQTFGWTWNYIALAISSALVFIPLYFIKETAGRHVSD
ncbi:MFS transporter [Sporolactobacillus sp. THM7-7]|nr:MFS transporter [Sporolactobacillus sp. THM7-7]